MVAPVTEKYEELVIQYEESTDTWVNICGMIDATVTRTSNLDTTEVPADCTDESLPLSIEKQVRSIDVSISGTGVWAATSDGFMKDWFYSSGTKNIRVQNVQAASGSVEFETGAAFITDLSNSRTKGQKVTASFSFEFDGTPTTTDAA